MKLKVFALFAASALAASAANITINATETGALLNDGSKLSSNGNYAVGWFLGAPAPAEIRDYFVFDLSTVSGTITSATLHLSSTNGTSTGYYSPDASETFTLFDVSTGLAALSGGTGGTAAYNDLGGGTSYGSLTILSPGGAAFYDVTLNAAGIAFLQANNGQIALGGAITTLTKGANNEAAFNGTNSTLTRQLVITTGGTAPTPEPATLLFAAMGLCGIALLKSMSRAERESQK